MKRSMKKRSSGQLPRYLVVQLHCTLVRSSCESVGPFAYRTIWQALACSGSWALKGPNTPGAGPVPAASLLLPCRKQSPQMFPMVSLQTSPQTSRQTSQWMAMCAPTALQRCSTLQPYINFCHHVVQHAATNMHCSNARHLHSYLSTVWLHTLHVFSTGLTDLLLTGLAFPMCVGAVGWSSAVIWRGYTNGD